MARRIGAMFGMVVIVGLAIFLMWRVYVHQKQTGGESDDISVIAYLVPKLDCKICAVPGVNI